MEQVLHRLTIGVVFFFFVNQLFSQSVELNYNDNASPFIEVKKRIAIFSEEGYLSAKYTNLNFYQDTIISDILNGDLNPHFFIFDKGKFGFMADLNPRLHFRIIDQFSGPVRTPTANPGIRFYVFGKGLMKEKRWTVFHFGYYHHSNGQDGEALSSKALGKIDPQFQSVNEGYHFNRYNGNFSTNYATAGVNFYWNKCLDTNAYFRPWLNRNFGNLFDPYYDDMVADIRVVAYESMIRFKLDVHTGSFTDSEEALIGFEPELKGYMAFVRPSVTYKLIRTMVNADDVDEHVVEYDRFKIDVSVATDNISKLRDYSLLSHINADVTYHIRVNRTSFASIFIQAGWTGSDMYNIYLEDQYAYFKLGLSVGNFVFGD